MPATIDPKPRPASPKEISDWLDRKIEPVVKELFRAEKAAGATAADLGGSVAGFFMKTAVGLALSNGCPKGVLITAINEEMKRFP